MKKGKVDREQIISGDYMSKIIRAKWTGGVAQVVECYISNT
jgi:hypothetical protein